MRTTLKTTILLIFSLWSSTLVMGQNSPYERLYNQEKLPADYTTPSLDKFTESLENNNHGHDHDHFTNEKNRKKFYLDLTYSVDQLLRSGYILYNDPIGNYINEVLNIIVDSNPELQISQPRAYILRSTAVNAFAVDNGIVFVSIGLLSQLENEAQLALILSHELVHVQENHGLDKFLETIKVDQKISSSNKSRTKQLDLAALEKNRYSREQEMEADNKGLTYFLNSQYNPESIKRVFDILRYSYLPYDEIVFEKSILEKLSTSLPDDLLLDEVQAINPAEEDEEQSTHPALSVRTAQFSQRLTGIDTKGKQDYLISEERFLDIQLRSRVELARLFLNRQGLAEAIYSGFLLSKIYGETAYSKEIIGKALYGLSKFRNNGIHENINSPMYPDIEGESQQVYYLINELTKEELNILAIAYNYDLYLEQSDNEALRSLVVDLFSELYIFHAVESLAEFSIISQTQQDTTESNKKPLSKIDKIKQTRNVLKFDAKKWDKFAFSPVLNDTTFRNVASEGFKLGKKLDNERDYYSGNTSQGRKYRNEVRDKGRSLGIDNVLIINPRFFHLTGSTNKPKLGYIKTNERETSLVEIIKSSAATHNVTVNLLNSNNLNTINADLLNELIETNDWVDNQFDTEGFLIQGYNQQEIEKIAAKYKTNYILSINVISHEPKSILKKIFNRRTKSFLAVTVFDIRDGRRSYLKTDFTPNYLNDTFLKSEFYDVFYQLSKEN